MLSASESPQQMSFHVFISFFSCRFWSPIWIFTMSRSAVTWTAPFTNCCGWTLFPLSTPTMLLLHPLFPTVTCREWMSVLFGFPPHYTPVLLHASVFKFRPHKTAVWFWKRHLLLQEASLHWIQKHLCLGVWVTLISIINTAVFVLT